ncbi:MAG: gamma-glutamyl-gamma-aminobutyrate hydrolase family protein [Treponema sp.]|jgi:putative glutamine amidotransferase|nr:gamma-glutamyl-gamma-aminobutyrate hydrolase family protein [Treponema sp.]
MQPIILISGEEGLDPQRGSLHFVLSKRYVAGVAKGGGLPCMPADIRGTGDYARLADGLVLTEGPDIHRGRYGKYYAFFNEMWDLCITRDDFEFALFHAFYQQAKPIFGIGRGMHLINAALGGTVLDKNKEAVQVQQVVVSEDTRLGAFCGDLPPVSGSGGAAIERLPSVLRAWAAGEDGTPEGIEHRELPIFGIGWRAEWEQRILGDLMTYMVTRCQRPQGKTDAD